MSQPNVLVITSHDLGRHLGCYGNDTVSSPHLDRLASDGVLFTNAFTTAPQCSPSRAALATGRYPHTNGVLGLTHASFAWDLHPGERHVAQILRDVGYRTGLIGIHHESRKLPDDEAATRCGMDVFLPGGRAETVTSHARAQLRDFAARDQPFYLQVGYFEVHRQPSPAAHTDSGADGATGYMGFVGDYIEPDDAETVEIPPFLRDSPGTRAEIAELNGSVRHLDEAIGQLLGELEELKLRENTLVIMTTDHGLPLPRAKCSLYDPGIETALICRLPARGWSGGTQVDSLVSNIDIMPTILDVAGVDVPDGAQGHSLRELLDPPVDSDVRSRSMIFAEMTYHDYYDPRRCVRTNQHKLIVNFTAAPSFMDPTQSWRPRADPAVPADPATAYHPLVELFDLSHDPHETTNLAEDSAYGHVRRDLLRELMTWMRDTDDPLLGGAVTSPLHQWATDLLASSAPG